MRLLDTASDLAEIREALSERPEEETERIDNVVRPILKDVRTRGDEAVAEYTRRFDWSEATADSLEVPLDTLREAQFSVDKELSRTFSRAAKNIRDYHNSERGHLHTWSQQGLEGCSLGQILQPVRRVGIYVPGGQAAYPSTVLMTAIPAIIAGVTEIILCTPPDSSGNISTLVAAAAATQNLDKVYRIGGAQAIAAMAYGTQTIPRVDVIVGPGNQYVNAAKRLVYGDVGIDMLAGPSEIAIIADATANPEFVAADLLAQTEHGPENRGVLFSPSQELLDSARIAIVEQRKRLSRKEILEATDNNLLLIKTSTLQEAFDLSNQLAPEHLELQIENPLAALSQVKNAGAVLLGGFSSAPIGDYLAGPSHTLPTNGAARFSSPLSVNTFMKRTSILYYSQDAATAMAGDVARFADSEGFDGHAAAARIRTQKTNR